MGELGFNRLRSRNLMGVLLVFLVSVAYADRNVGQTLDQAANDPTASLMSVQIQNIYTGDYHNPDDENGNSILLCLAVPFTTGSLKHIARATLPIVTESPSEKSGLSDLVLFDLIVFDKAWGRWGVGPVLLAPTASKDELGSEKWAIGPAAGFVARSHAGITALPGAISCAPGAAQGRVCGNG